MENKDNEALFEEIDGEAFIEERPDNEAMIEEVSDEVFIEERELRPHSICITQPQHGLLMAYPPKAIVGEVIGIRCNNNKPDEYKIKGINVITSNSIQKLSNLRSSKTKDSNSPFESVFGSFQMPDSDVTIEAVFEKADPNFKELHFCTKCNTRFYKPYSNYCHHCGRKRL